MSMIEMLLIYLIIIAINLFFLSIVPQMFYFFDFILKCSLSLNLEMESIKSKSDPLKCHQNIRTSHVQLYDLQNKRKFGTELNH